MTEPLTTTAAQLQDTAALITHLAILAEDIRTTRPRGYGVARPIDGVRRPVEDIIVALDDRGVTAAIYNAAHTLAAALNAAKQAALYLDDAINKWEGDRD